VTVLCVRGGASARVPHWTIVRSTVPTSCASRLSEMGEAGRTDKCVVVNNHRHQFITLLSDHIISVMPAIKHYNATLSKSPNIAAMLHYVITLGSQHNQLVHCILRRVQSKSDTESSQAATSHSLSWCVENTSTLSTTLVDTVIIQQ
jgi:hypothetical protein